MIHYLFPICTWTFLFCFSQNAYKQGCYSHIYKIWLQLFSFLQVIQNIFTCLFIIFHFNHTYIIFIWIYFLIDYFKSYVIHFTVVNIYYTQHKQFLQPVFHAFSLIIRKITQLRNIGEIQPIIFVVMYCQKIYNMASLFIPAYLPIRFHTLTYYHQYCIQFL